MLAAAFYMVKRQINIVEKLLKKTMLHNVHYCKNEFKNENKLITLLQCIRNVPRELGI